MTRWRLALLVLPLALLVATSPLALAGEEPAASTPFVVGAGTASGTVAAARIFYGGLSIPVPIGQSAASFEGKRSRSLGAVVSASAVSGLTGADVPGTSPVVVDSQSPEHHLESALADPVAGTVTLDAAATPQALSEVRILDLDLPGVAAVAGGQVRSTSGVVDGNRRVSQATVTIASLSLGGGLVELDGLHWEASHASGAGEPEASASFRVGGLRLAGMVLPLPVDGVALQGLADLLNGVLGPIGITISLPQITHLADGSVDASALRVAYGHGPLGTEVVGPVLAALRPLLLPVIEAVVTPDSGLGVATLLLDLGLGVADGSGGASLSLGGVNAGTADTAYTAPGPTRPPATPTGATPAPVGGGSGVGFEAPAPVVTPPAALLPTSADGGPARCALAAGPRRQGGCRSANETAALAVGIVAVLGAAAYEVAIRRRRPGRSSAAVAR